MKREGTSTLSIHGYPWALRYLLSCVFKIVCLLFNCGFKRVSLKISVRLLYQSPRVFEKIAFESFLKRCRCEKYFEFCLKLEQVS